MIFVRLSLLRSLEKKNKEQELYAEAHTQINGTGSERMIICSYRTACQTQQH
jgi:hypothetical protein